MDAKKEDRRIQRTKQLLRDSLMALIVERGAWDPITIQDITDHANVSRTTFYLHFRDKEDLMITSMTEVYNDLLNSVESGIHSPDVAESLDFVHVAENAAFYRVMVGPKGSPVFVSRIQEYLAKVVYTHFCSVHLEAGQKPIYPLEALTNYIAGAEIGLIRWWLESGMEQSPQEMARMFERICVDGMGQFFPMLGERNIWQFVEAKGKSKV
jgi:AcrR family transcriptional regulator